jgi:hypothetical protein
LDWIEPDLQKEAKTNFPMICDRVNQRLQSANIFSNRIDNHNISAPFGSWLPKSSLRNFEKAEGARNNKRKAEVAFVNYGPATAVGDNAIKKFKTRGSSPSSTLQDQQVNLPKVHTIYVNYAPDCAIGRVAQVQDVNTEQPIPQDFASDMHEISVMKAPSEDEVLGMNDEFQHPEGLDCSQNVFSVGRKVKNTLFENVENEFKESIPSKASQWDQIEKCLVGMANKNGGSLWIGITDKGIARGVKDSGNVVLKFLTKMRLMMETFCTSCRDYECRIHHTNKTRRKILQIQVSKVAKQQFRLCRAHDDAVYIRMEKSTRRLEQGSILEELTILSKQKMVSFAQSRLRCLHLEENIKNTLTFFLHEDGTASQMIALYCLLKLEGDDLRQELESLVRSRSSC